MEFVPGKTLQDLMSEEGAMSPVRAFELMQPICAGVATAHREGTVHGNLNPLNVIIQEDLPIAEGVKILEFGQPVGGVGSPFYLAPEQWSDEPPDARADVYSLGVMLYQMLCGEVPFKGDSVPAIMKSHLTAEVPTFASHGVEVPPQIEAVVRHALEKDPKYRTSGTEEFLDELRRAMAAVSAVSPTAGDTARTKPLARSKPPAPPATAPPKRKFRSAVVTKPTTLDNVRCSVFAPEFASQGQQFLVQVFPHLFEQEKQVAELAREFDDTASRRAVRTLAEPIARGAKLTFQLMMPGLIVEEPVQSQVWQALPEPEPVQFSVSVPADHPTKPIIGKVTVSLNTVPVGHIHFKLTIVAARSEFDFPSHSSTQWKPYKKAFISYASPDRKEVLKRVQMLELAGIKYFQDLLSLEPGQRWERALYREIDSSDLFLLFWSNNAKESEWVMNEVHYALKRKSDDDLAPPEILPVIIEGPPPVPPPPELAHLHFNHYLIYFMS